MAGVRGVRGVCGEPGEAVRGVSGDSPPAGPCGAPADGLSDCRRRTVGVWIGGQSSARTEPPPGLSGVTISRANGVDSPGSRSDTRVGARRRGPPLRRPLA